MALAVDEVEKTRPREIPVRIRETSTLCCMGVWVDEEEGME